MRDFPAGRFAVSATAWLAGRTSYDHALDGLTGDRAHRVTGLPGTAEAVPLGAALSAVRGLGERRFRLVLPVAGDVRGLPPVPGLAALALESGQAAVGDRLALVPEPIGPEAIAWTAFDLAGAEPVPPPVWLLLMVLATMSRGPELRMPPPQPPPPLGPAGAAPVPVRLPVMTEFVSVIEPPSL